MTGGDAADPPDPADPADPANAILEPILVALLPAGAVAITIARIWATVDVDRAIRALDVDARPLPDDELLGAAVRLVPGTAAGEPPLVLLEPRTEGRLAAHLARFGEGPAGRYVAASGGLEAARRAAEDGGIALSREAAGPFGQSALVLGGPVAGPLLVLVEPRAGTIDR